MARQPHDSSGGGGFTSRSCQAACGSGGSAITATGPEDVAAEAGTESCREYESQATRVQGHLFLRRWALEPTPAALPKPRVAFLFPSIGWIYTTRLVTKDERTIVFKIGPCL